MNDRCDECGGERTYCGEMSFDGPKKDCLTCRLRDKIASLTRERDALLATAEKCRAAGFIDENGEIVPGIIVTNKARPHDVDQFYKDDQAAERAKGGGDA